MSGVLIEKFQDTEEGLNSFASKVLLGVSKQANAFLNAPVVYIHEWHGNRTKYCVYVGEANDFVQRTRQHYQTGRDVSGSWQHELIRQKEASLYVVTHPHFNKSLTLDIENKLISYMVASEGHVCSLNRRGNPQDDYYDVSEFDAIFSEVWSGLRGFDSELFRPAEEIQASAIFKASPLHKLTAEQKRVQFQLLNLIKSVEKKNTKTGRLVFVTGDAGSGKTVLMSSTFHALCCREPEEDKERKYRCVLLVNHEEQFRVYCQIAERLGLSAKSVVFKPTQFINRTPINSPVDVAFVDEAHLLWTQGKQSYQGKNQLADILQRAKVTVAVFDPMQVLRTQQYWEEETLQRFINKSEAVYNLDGQLRIQAPDEVIRWIHNFVKNRVITPIPQSGSYEIRIFKTPDELEKAILAKANQPSSRLSRMVATYDWPYNEKPPQDLEQEHWNVTIGNWSRPWNYQLRPSKEDSKKVWAEQSQTNKEIGSTFTIQGFDLNYAGVILGESVEYRNGRVQFNPDKSHNDNARQRRTLTNGEKKSFACDLLQHELNVLMTRGVNGLYIYAVDQELRNELLRQEKLRDS